MLAVFSLCVAAAVQDPSISTLKIQSRILMRKGRSLLLSRMIHDGKDLYPVLYVLDAEHEPSFLKSCSSVEQLSSKERCHP